MVCLLRRHSQSVLTVTDPVIHGEAFDLNCTVSFSVLPEDIHWFIVEQSTDFKIYTFTTDGTGSTGNDHDHLVERDVNAFKISDTRYTLNIKDADMNTDKAGYRCEKSGEIRSLETKIVNICSQCSFSSYIYAFLRVHSIFKSQSYQAL